MQFQTNMKFASYSCGFLIYVILSTVSSFTVIPDSKGYVKIDTSKDNLSSSMVNFSFKSRVPNGVILVINGDNRRGLIFYLINGRVNFIALQGSNLLLSGNFKDFAADKKWHNLSMRCLLGKCGFAFDEKELQVDVHAEVLTFRVDSVCISWVCIQFALPLISRLTKSVYRGCIKNLEIENHLLLTLMQIPIMKSAGTAWERTYCEGEVLGSIAFPNPWIRLTFLLHRNSPEDLFQFQAYIRTFKLHGVIFYGYGYRNQISLSYNSTRTEVKLQMDEKSELFVSNKTNISDGALHFMATVMTQTTLYLQIDDIVQEFQWRKNGFLDCPCNNIKVFTLGGSDFISKDDGFAGCMSSVELKSKIIRVIDKTKPKRPKAVFDHCHLKDHCHSSPCQNQGKCVSSWEGYKCDCSQTNYHGKHCEIPVYKPDCLSYAMMGLNRPSFCILDPDGTGGHNPFTTACLFTSADEPLTSFHHNREYRTQVARGSFRFKEQEIRVTYKVPLHNIKAVVASSRFCRQFLLIECQQMAITRFRHSFPTVESPMRVELLQTFWGGQKERQSHCNCGFVSYCWENNTCQCDSTSSALSSSQGFITNKTLLPLTKLIFQQGNGSTAFIRVGPLECFHREHGDQKLKRIDSDIVSKACVAIKDARKILSNRTYLDSLLPRPFLPQSSIIFATKTTMHTSKGKIEIFCGYSNRSHCKRTLDEEDETQEHSTSLSLVEKIMICVAVIAALVLIGQFIGACTTRELNARYG